MDSPEQRVKIAIAESERLRKYLAALPPHAWTKHSACDGWEVRDVVEHLAGGAEFYRDMLSRGLQGESSPPQGYPAPGSVNASTRGEHISKSAISERGSTQYQLLLRFVSTSDRLNELLTRLRPEDLDTPCYHPGGILPTRAFVRFRVLELALHGWDIRFPIETSAALSTETLPSLVEMTWEIFRWIFRPGDRLAKPIRYYFDVSGAVPVQRHFVVEGDKAWIEALPKAPGPDVTFRCDTETYVLLVFGRLSVESAATEGRLKIQGDSSLASKFGWWFQGP